MFDYLSPDEERKLIEELPEQPEGFRQLYRCYFPRVYAYTAARIGNHADTEDLVADVFVKIVEALDRFEYRGSGSFAAWVFRIAYNTVQQFYRQRQSLVSFDALTRVADYDHSKPESIYLNKERSTLVHAMLETLSPRRQEILTMRYFGGLRNMEIAEVLGLNEKTVASHISRGLEDLQKKYRKQDVPL